MNFTNDNYPLNTYDPETELKIKGSLFELLKEAEHMNCVSCRKPLNPDRDVHIYDHDGGWTLLDSIPKQWVSIECSCGYHTSISKLGIRR